MEHTLMACGHVAQGHVQDTGEPICVICVCKEKSTEKPDLTGRMAKCDECDRPPIPSSYDLAFFEYRGPGSFIAKYFCKVCGYLKEAHEKDSKWPHLNPPHQFEPHGPYDTDHYYCGCHGWD